MIYDLGIIGAGPAGYVAAEKAGKNGLKVVLFDKQYLGGVCLNEGCIPTKTLLYSAKLYQNALEGEKYGILAPEVAVDYKKMYDRKNKVVKKLVAGVGSKMKHSKIEVVMGAATISERAKEGFNITCEGNTYSCNNILIATGSEPLIPPIPGLDKVDYLTSKEILELQEVPENLTIIGGGVIGIEFANLFTTLGTKVTIVEMMDEIVPGMDSQLAGMLRQELARKGCEFHLKSKVIKVEKNALIIEKEGEEEKIEAALLLISVGRKPIIEGFGLEHTGVELFKGGIKIDSNCRTNIPNIYAAGDVTGFSLLAHTASREAEVAVNHILGKKDTMRYQAVPGVVYTNPEFSSVGLTEEEAKKRDVAIKVIALPMNYAGRFIAENEGKNGICKVIIGSENHLVLGVHMLGNPSSELIFGAAMAIEMEIRMEDLQEIIFPHPTVSEIMKECANVV